MDLSGFKINFLGDSITEGAGASVYNNCFVKLVESKTGAYCRNYGIGGTRIARNKVPSKNPLYDQDFCSRIEKMDSDADVIVVFGGTNDFGHGDAMIGTIDDRTPDTFYGALHYLYSNLITKYPDSLIFVITPLHRTDEDSQDRAYETNENLALREYVHIIKAVAEFYSLPVLDLFADSGIYPPILAHKEKYTVDGLHPNDFGHNIISNRVIDFITQNIKSRL